MPASYPDFSILIVDDDEVDVRGVRRGLSKQKISNPVFVACDGQEALDMLRGVNGHERLLRPYLILLDLNMPLMGGIEFVADLTTREPFPASTKVAAMVREAGLRNGIVTYPGTGMAGGTAGDII